MAFLDGNGLGTLLIALKNYFVSKTTFDNTIEDFSDGKQDLLVSGSNIKTINNESILGSGNINVSGSSGNSTLIVNLTEEHDSDYLFSSDKTFNNVLTALNSGIIPIFRIHLDSNYFNYYFINEVNYEGDKYYLYLNGSPFRYVCEASNSELDENMNFKLENQPV